MPLFGSAAKSSHCERCEEIQNQFSDAQVFHTKKHLVIQGIQAPKLHEVVAYLDNFDEYEIRSVTHTALSHVWFVLLVDIKPNSNQSNN